MTYEDLPALPWYVRDGVGGWPNIFDVNGTLVAQVCSDTVAQLLIEASEKIAANRRLGESHVR
jgi:hypothetical protein